MKVLSAIIAHPYRKICGATNAGRELSVETAKLVPLDLAIMWDADERHTVDGLTVRHFRCFSRAGFFNPLLPRFARIPLYDSRIPEFLRSVGYDLVHIHNLIPAFAAERLANECRRAAIPYVISTHGFNELARYAEINGFGRMKTWMAEIGIARPFRRIVAGASAIFALSDCERPLLAQLGVPEERIHIVTNGVSEFYLKPPNPEETAAVQKKFNIGSEPLLLYMGSLHRYKGVGVFLRSLAQADQPFHAVVGGSFKHSREPEQMLHDAGLTGDAAEMVTFTGRLSDAELRALYHLADVFVYPTEGDTLPLVVLEAMAAGVPIVSTQVGGIPCMVTRECGMLVPPGDAQAVAVCVNRLLAAPERRTAMGRASRDRVERNFRWPVSARCASAAYESVLNGVKVAQAGSRGAR